MEEKLNQLVNKHKEDQNTIQLLINLEKLCILRKDTYGSSSKEFRSTVDQLAELCKEISLNLLETNSSQKGIEFLLKVEELLVDTLDLALENSNNIGCYYRMINDNKNALIYFNKAILQATELKNMSKLAENYYNLASVLFEIGEVTL